jgi:hypothetical protein
MKLIHAAIAAIAMAACSHGGVEIPITRTLAPQTIPGDATAHQLAVSGVLPDSQKLSLEWRLSQAPTDTTGVAWASLSAVQLTIDPPTDGSPTPCWDFVETVTLRVASTKSDSTLEPVEIARTTAPGCTQTLTLDTDPNVDLSPYAREGFNLIVTASGIPPERDVTFSGSYTLTLSVL